MQEGVKVLTGMISMGAVISMGAYAISPIDSAKEKKEKVERKVQKTEALTNQSRNEAYMDEQDRDLNIIAIAVKGDRN